MSANTKSTAVRESSEPVSTYHYWQVFAVEGPAELYHGFAVAAVDEFLKIQGPISDEQTDLIRDVLGIGVSVALKAAGVADSWLPQYEAATAHLKHA